MKKDHRMKRMKTNKENKGEGKRPKSIRAHSCNSVILFFLLFFFCFAPVFAQESLEQAAYGESDNFFEEYNDVLVVIVWIAALLIAFIIVAVWKRGMNTARSQTQAGGYVVAGSLKYKDKKDTFTNSKTTKTRKQSTSGGKR